MVPLDDHDHRHHRSLLLIMYACTLPPIFEREICIHSIALPRLLYAIAIDAYKKHKTKALLHLLEHIKNNDSYYYDNNTFTDP
jgi:hypothetical protein